MREWALKEPRGELKMISIPPLALTKPFVDVGGDERFWIGWREWVSLPDLGYDRIEVKIDTGAKTSSIHAWKIEPAGTTQDDNGNATTLLQLTLDCDGKMNGERRLVLAPLLRHATVVDSSGRRERRPVVLTRIILGQIEKVVEVNITNRETMKFPMILGRSALEGEFLVDVNREFLLGRPKGARE